MSTDALPPSEPPPASAAPPARGAWARSWALSLSWGWLALLVAAAVAVALDRPDLRDALDVPGRLAADAAPPARGP
jgi:hypothetical protein